MQEEKSQETIQEYRMCVSWFSKQSLSPSLMPPGERKVEEERNRAEGTTGNGKKRGGMRAKGRRAGRRSGETKPSILKHAQHRPRLWP